MGIFDFFSSDIAIDLGTANTLIIHKGKVVVDEPSIIAIDMETNKVLAIGREAMQMHEKTIKSKRPAAYEFKKLRIKKNPRKNRMGSKRVGFYFIAVAMVVIILYFID